MGSLLPPLTWQRPPNLQFLEQGKPQVCTKLFASGEIATLKNVLPFTMAFFNAVLKFELIDGNDVTPDSIENLDPLTETYGLAFYLQYLAHWPEYFQVIESPTGQIMGYIMGKAEGNVQQEEWHGHVTAVTVAPEYRRLGLAAKLMSNLEEISEKKDAFFVDLFVRMSNNVAVDMYKQLGYVIYRRVLEYYSGDPDEDAYDMRKALSRDKEKKSVIPVKDPVRPEDLE